MGTPVVEATPVMVQLKHPPDECECCFKAMLEVTNVAERLHNAERNADLLRDEIDSVREVNVRLHDELLAMGGER